MWGWDGLGWFSRSLRFVTYALCTPSLWPMCSAPRITALAMVLVRAGDGSGALVPPTDPVAALSLLSTEGGEVIRITGTNLGPALPRSYVTDVWYGLGDARYTLVNCTFITPHEQLECVTVAGTGRGLHAHVSILGQVATMASSMSYAPPSVLLTSPAAVPTTGSIVTVNGTNFGATSASIQVLVNGLVTASTLMVRVWGCSGSGSAMSPPSSHA